MSNSEEKNLKIKIIFQRIWKYFKYIFIGGTSNQRIFRSYLYIILIGTILLLTPWAVNKADYRGLINALFTASSAFSDTGLTVYNSAKDLTFFGQLVVIILIQVGGIGVMTLKIIFFVLIGQTISIQERIILQSERGSSKLGDTVELIKNAFYVLTFIEVLGAISLFFYFYFMPIDYFDSLKTFNSKNLFNFLLNSFSNEEEFIKKMLTIPGFEGFTSLEQIKDHIFSNYTSINFLKLIKENNLAALLVDSLFLETYHDFTKSFWSAIFHSVSATNNAGFDIIGPNSLSPFRTHYFVQIVFIIQLIIGGIGYPVFYDFRQKIAARLNGTRSRLSLFTKVSLIIYTAATLICIFMILMIEYLTPVNIENSTGLGVQTQTSGTFDNIMAIIFSSFSTRSAGYSTVDINTFKLPSKFVFSIMMWIGASPASTGGGIRTTTLIVVILAIYSTAIRRRDINLLRSKIPIETVKKATSVFLLALLAVLFVTFIIISENMNVSFIEAIFITASAFGTAGLTINPDFGSTFAEYKTFSKILLITLMFIGQLGLSNTILLAAQRDEIQNYSYAEEDILIA